MLVRARMLPAAVDHVDGGVARGGQGADRLEDEHRVGLAARVEDEVAGELCR
jgi:hypothetical protein